MPTIAIAGASGKLGGATLSALLAHNLVPASSIVALTSSHPGSSTFTTLAATAPGLQVRHASFEDPASFERALQGVDRFFLVSTPHIQLDFDRLVVQGGGKEGEEKKKWEEVPDGQGRERHHRVAIDAAVRAGVKDVYYSSLAFAYDPQSKSATNKSKAGVMRAHLRTEAYLARLRDEGRLDNATVIREGLYAESWPLYLGYFAGDGDDERREVPLAGDGKISWTAIGDLGVANAVVLAAPEGEGEGEFKNRLFYLSTRARTAKSIAEVAGLVGAARGRDVRVRVVGREEHVRYYVEERGMDEAAVRWWVSTYEALEEGECEVDDGMLEELLGRVGAKPEGVEEVIRRMVKG
ncbi:NAD(P)-binding protein [Daldinia vernicosa]|uniref:NAD(P)-binding protein n=1 Tax=Daldinia vernicosa TaxID=114800 RepID=UPI00200819CC|nr:NAD(P)-binding protein [Daldinia vernicosa]KAI0846570.1 NAD(P)-binding protein [Daldinia vernicosa]